MNLIIEMCLSIQTYLKPKHFRIIRLIGQGSVGQVYEVVKRDSGRTYAMKVLSKRLLLAENQVNAAINERNVLAQSLTDPFIVNLKYSFQTVHSLFLVMDYFPGGELFDFLGCERCLSEKQCQLFAAEIVCALDNIHSRNIVFRNLRSESILLDAHGHLALTDFGLCKQLANDQDTIQGVVPAGITQEYLAPEMVLQQPYGKPVDWWSLGILMFELLTGSPPFQSVNEIELFRQILYGPIKFTAAGSCISQEAKDFVYQLLRRNPTKRLGSRSGVSQIKAHPFFNGINWDIVYKKQIHLPFTPDVKEQLQEEDLAVAAAAAAPTPRNETAKYHLLLVSEQPKFKGFSYNHEDHSILKGVHSLGVHPDDEDPEVDFWFRQ
jgi:protein-serine/threonine kinase